MVDCRAPRRTHEGAAARRHQDKLVEFTLPASSVKNVGKRCGEAVLFVLVVVVPRLQRMPLRDEL